MQELKACKPQQPQESVLGTDTQPSTSITVQ
jgi:hypothetical protein